MKTVLIHGQNHKGSTYQIARQLAEKIGGENHEFFLPKDFDQFCIGCCNCFAKDESLCPHYEKLKPITAAMDASCAKDKDIKGQCKTRYKNQSNVSCRAADAAKRF